MKTNRKGFTLLELLLALAIFTIIGIATTRHIQQLVKTKQAAISELDIYDNVRAALAMIRSDLSQAFHVLYDDLGQEAKQLVLQNQQVPHTLFDGRKTEIVFTSLSHRVYYANVKECEQTEISYFLQPKPNQKYPSLMKRNSRLIDGDLYQGGEIYTLLENVVSLQFQYWDEKVAKWVDNWNSDDGEYRDRFPMAVRARIRLDGQGKDGLYLQEDFKIAFPNNDQQLVSF